MCIFNGAFALWVSGRVGEEAPLRSDFDRHCRVWQTRICLRALRQGGAVAEQIERQRNEKHLWGESCRFDWLPGCLSGWLAEDEYCMVPCSRGLVTGEDGSKTPQHHHHHHHYHPPSLAYQSLLLPLCVSLSLSLSLLETTATIMWLIL